VVAVDTLAALVEAVVVAHTAQAELLILAVVLVLIALVVVVVLALSSFAMQTHLQPQHQLQAHPQSLLLAATVSINGLVQGALHSDGTLCKT
jgi:hypothetical protein